jgi:hypothetical protein
MALFEPNAPWLRAASAVTDFEIWGEQFFREPPHDLRQIVVDLRRRDIGLAVGLAPLSASGPGTCGYHVEGYGAPRGPLALAQRLAAIDASPKHFVMDEPLYFGHVFNRAGVNFGCRSSIVEVARDVASKVRQVRTIFPDAQFGDVEPFTFSDQDPWFRSGAWIHDLSAWLDAYEAAVGGKLAFIRIDMWWNTAWQVQMPTLTNLLRDKGVPLQVIYNGDGQDESDAAWIGHAISHFQQFESGAWRPPDAAVIQFWTPHPSRILPESDPLTATGLIDRYLDWHQSRHKR